MTALTPSRKATGQEGPANRSHSRERLRVSFSKQGVVKKTRKLPVNPSVLPEARWRQSLTCSTFVVPMHGIKALEAFLEPTRSSNLSLARESGAEDARTPDASRPPGVSEPRKASGVSPIYRRFPSGAGRPAVHGPNARS